MTETDEERELRARFTRMREDDRARAIAPDFESMLERSRHTVERSEAERPMRPTRGLGRLVPWVSLAGAAVAAALVLTGRQQPEIEFDRIVVGYSAVAPGLWDSPTSGLLRIPGSDLLGSVPALGTGTLPDLSTDSGEDGP